MWSARGIPVALVLASAVAWTTVRAASIIVAENLDDVAADGQCSLVEAMVNANDDAATHPDCAAGDGADVLELTGTSYSLSVAVDDSDGATGLPSVTGELVIAANGASIRRPGYPYCGNRPEAEFRLIHVAPDGKLRIEQATLKNGCAVGFAPPGSVGRWGGNVFNRGELTLVDTELLSGEGSLGGGIYNAPGGAVHAIDSKIAGSRASTGGGIANEGKMVLESTTVGGNRATTGGGIWNVGVLRIAGGAVGFNHPTSTFGGCGIVNAGDLELEDCEIRQNSGGLGGNGAGLRNTGRARITNCVLDENTTARQGGAISNEGGQLVIEGGRIRGNIADDAAAILNSAGGTARVARTWIEGNQSADVAGAIWSTGRMTIDRCKIDNNFGYPGGGVNNLGWMRITDSSFSGNTSSGPLLGGGAVFNHGTLTVTRSAAYGNYAGCCGGGFFNSGLLTLVNSTVSGNETPASNGSGAGVYNSGTLRMVAATITGNTGGGEGAGIAVAGGGRALIRQSIVAGNASPGATDCAAVLPSGGTITSAGYNLTESGGACPADGPGDRTVDAAELFESVLGPLGDHGGPTPTHPLLSDSPAIDAASGRCPPPATDQRGARRPSDGDGDGLPACDIGAFEYKGR